MQARKQPDAVSVVHSYLDELARRTAPDAEEPVPFTDGNLDGAAAALRLLDEAPHWQDVATALAICTAILNGLPDMARYLTLTVLMASSGMGSNEAERWLQSARSLVWAIDRHDAERRYESTTMHDSLMEDGDAPF